MMHKFLVRRALAVPGPADLPTGRLSWALLCGATLVLCACTEAGPQPTQQVRDTSKPPVASMVSPDFDGDGGADLAVGVGSLQARVSVGYSNGRTLEFTRAELDDTDSGDFGQALLARDLDRDGYTDLVVADAATGGGAPGVFLVKGSANGLELEKARRVDAPAGVSGFGTALALVEEPSPLLVVGAPGTGGGKRAGGVVVAYELGADGIPTGDPDLIGQESIGLPGDGEPGDGFGSVLAATGSRLFVGVPRADLGPARDAGAVVTLHFLDDGMAASQLTQDSPGVRGEVETGDMFGLSLAAGDGYLAVGVPLEDYVVKDVGIVQPFRIVGDALEALPFLDQGPLPGQPETGDAFGRALAIARPCPGVPGVLVGAPDEAIGANRQAGSVWLVPFEATASCPTSQIYEGVTSEGPTALENSLYGSAVSSLRTGADQADTLVIAAAGVAEEAVPGRVLALAPPFQGSGRPVLRELNIHEERAIAFSSPQG